MPNTYSQIYYHIVFSPRYRKSLITPELEEKLFPYITGITKNLGQHLIQINGMPDHLHLLVRLKPIMAPSVFVGKIKSNSSNWINNLKIFNTEFSWQAGGGIFSVDHRSVSKISNYIKNQKQHHRKSSFKEEYLQLLKAYGVAYEEKYLLNFFD